MANGLTHRKLKDVTYQTERAHPGSNIRVKTDPKPKEITVKSLNSGGKEKVLQASKKNQIIYKGSGIKMTPEVSTATLRAENKGAARTKFGIKR